MAFPDYPTIPDPWPDRAQGQSAFDTAVSGTFTFFGNLETWSDEFKVAAEGVQAAWLADNVGSLTGKDYRGLMVNGAADALAFSAPLHTLAGHRNKIINGQFGINQRGAASYTATGYTLDRWTLSLGSGAACTITRRDDFAAGVTLGSSESAGIPGNPEFYLRWARGTAGTALSLLRQRIEGVEALSGQTATLTFWARGTAATQLRAVAAQTFGTGGSPSTTAITWFGSDFSITTSWQKFTVSVSLPSVSGDTLGSNGDDALELRFIRDHDDTNPTASVDIANVSLVSGDATNEEDPGAWRDETTEINLCRRYYTKLDWDAGHGKMYGVESGGADIGAGSGVFPAQMRTTPTAAQSGLSLLNCAFSSIHVGKDCFSLRVDITSTGYYRAFGGTLTFDAEL